MTSKRSTRWGVLTNQLNLTDFDFTFGTRINKEYISIVIRVNLQNFHLPKKSILFLFWNHKLLRVTKDIKRMNFKCITWNLFCLDMFYPHKFLLLPISMGRVLKFQAVFSPTRHGRLTQIWFSRQRLGIRCAAECTWGHRWLRRGILERQDDRIHRIHRPKAGGRYQNLETNSYRRKFK